MTNTSHVEGYILIDAMIAMVVMVFGILGLINLQARLVLDNQRAQLRTQASLMATQLLSAAGSDSANATCYVVPLQGGCGNATAQTFTTNWLAAVNNTMPAATLNPPTATLNADGSMTVTIFWRLNQETVFHRYIVRSQVQ